MMMSKYKIFELLNRIKVERVDLLKDLKLELKCFSYACKRHYIINVEGFTIYWHKMLYMHIIPHMCPQISESWKTWMSWLYQIYDILDLLVAAFPLNVSAPASTAREEVSWNCLFKDSICCCKI